MPKISKIISNGTEYNFGGGKYIDIELVGGGGGGAYGNYSSSGTCSQCYYYLGGAGGGGMISCQHYPLFKDTYNIIVGDGGAGASQGGCVGCIGCPSCFGAELIAYGGGGVGNSTNAATGGGGPSFFEQQFAYHGPQGYESGQGGSANSNCPAGHGGGGAGGPGQLATNSCGAACWRGGNGRQSIINGTYYGAGAGGRNCSGGRRNGEGRGNCGSGGCGCCNGCKGIVLIRYASDGSWGIKCATGGTKTTSGEYTIHCFTSNGTFCIKC